MATIKRALISVSDKTGILELAQGLTELGIEILSTGGTAGLLEENGVSVKEVSSHTGFPEIMDGRVKTLHPKIHGGILARRGTDDAVMAEQDIDPIDLIVVNLYPFTQTIAREDCDLSMAIENIDIGGPTMVRAAAKNHAHVSIVVDPADYPALLEEINNSNGNVSDDSRFSLAVKAFEHTAAYDAAIANYLSGVEAGGEHLKFPRTHTAQFTKKQDLRYGENPHQDGAFYIQRGSESGSIGAATQLQGKELSYNNIADTDAALDCVSQFDETCCVIVKHANPCGVALGDDLLTAYDRAYATDPTSAFGGIIAFNKPLDVATAKTILDRQFVEVIAVPSIEKGVEETLASKPNVRVMITGEFPAKPTAYFDYKRVNGGLLVQDKDYGSVSLDDLQIVTDRAPTDQEIRDLFFAWRVARCVKSNAIVYASDTQTVGVGAGQMSRVYSARIAGIKAADEGLPVTGSVMASDAFFPFRDGIDLAAEAGIKAVIQPGGSMRDKEVIEAANEHGIAMVFTGMRHFRH